MAETPRRPGGSPVRSKSELSAIRATFDPDGKIFARLAVCSPPFDGSWREVVTNTAVAGYPLPAGLESELRSPRTPQKGEGTRVLFTEPGRSTRSAVITGQPVRPLAGRMTESRRSANAQTARGNLMRPAGGRGRRGTAAHGSARPAFRHHPRKRCHGRGCWP